MNNGETADDCLFDEENTYTQADGLQDDDFAEKKTGCVKTPNNLKITKWVYQNSIETPCKCKRVD